EYDVYRKAKRDLIVMQALLARGADVHARDEVGNTAIGYAMFWQEPTPPIRMLAEHGADVNEVGWPSDMTPLMQVSNRGNLAIVRTLLEYHADVNKQNTEGDTALTMRVYDGYDDNAAIVKELLAHHADFRHKNKIGETALSIAKENHATHIIHLLRQA